MVNKMKKILPYLLSLIIGTAFGLLLFRDADFNIKEVFSETVSATAFQLGVFNNKEGAENLAKRYEAIVMKDDDVYRVYYSILTNQSVINKMEAYLRAENIDYYLKNITIKDEELIKAIKEYEKTMIEGGTSVLISVNKLITSSYKGDRV